MWFRKHPEKSDFNWGSQPKFIDVKINLVILSIQFTLTGTPQSINTYIFSDDTGCPRKKYADLVGSSIMNLAFEMSIGNSKWLCKGILCNEKSQVKSYLRWTLAAHQMKKLK